MKTHPRNDWLLLGNQENLSDVLETSLFLLLLLLIETFVVVVVVVVVVFVHRRLLLLFYLPATMHNKLTGRNFTAQMFRFFVVVVVDVVTAAVVVFVVALHLV